MSKDKKPIFLNRLDSSTVEIYGKFIKDWESIRRAAKVCSVDATGISACCRGTQKTSGGYKWAYSEDYYKEE